MPPIPWIRIDSRASIEEATESREKLVAMDCTIMLKQQFTKYLMLLRYQIAYFL